MVLGLLRGGWGRVMYLQTCNPEGPVCRFAIVLIFFQLFLD